MRLARTLLCALCLLCVFAGHGEAGGGPETTLVVVNADSPASLRVANHYARLRGIPASHLCFLRGVPNLTVIDVNTFRERIWKPIETFLTEHELADEIDVITYSVDFPFGVNFDADFKGKQLGQLFDRFRVASLTGLTFLIDRVRAKTQEYLDPRCNNYFRWPGYGELHPGHGFSRSYGWTLGKAQPEREPDPDTAYRYYLATHLGFTGLKGNTVPEVLACLDRAAACDGKHPRGTVYLMRSKDKLRSGPRVPQFETVVERLEKLGRKAVVLGFEDEGQDGKLPIGKDDVMGCVAGVAGFSWPGSKSTMLPGCIAEHLTSFGGRFDTSGQTKISEFIRAGAAGSSGAVAEPYNHPIKFPAASLHVHYAEGCSLAESFYQSFGTPYQMIVIGDPLARPYARFAEVALPEVPKGAWSGTVGLNVDVDLPDGKDVKAVELWVDGQRLAAGPLRPPLEIDTTKLADGEHELRVVVIEDSPIETRSAAVRRFRVKNGKSVVSIKGPKKSTAYGSVAKLSGKASKATEVVVLRGLQVVAAATRSGSTWKAAVDTQQLGVGTVPLQARARFADGTVVLSAVLDLEVGEAGGGKTKKSRKPRKRRAAKAKPPQASGRNGLRATVVGADGKAKTFTVTTVGAQGKARFLTELRKQVQGKLTSVRLEGQLEVPIDGAYRFAINAHGKLEVKVKGATVFEAEDLVMDRQVYAGFALKAGWHDLEVTYEPAGTGDLSIWLGGAVVSAPLTGKTIRH